MPITPVCVLKEKASAIGLKVFEGIHYGTDLKKVSVDISNLDSFYELARELGAKFILLDSYAYDQETLETWLIDEDEVRESEDDPELQKKIIKEARLYNKNVLKTPVGAIANFSLTFFSDGITYDYSESEDWADIAEPGDALDLIYERDSIRHACYFLLFNKKEWR